MFKIMDEVFLTGSKGLRNKMVKIKFREDLEPQEVFLDRLAQKKEKDLGISEKKFEVPLSKKLLQGLSIFIIVLILFLFGKTFQFQVLEKKNFLTLSQGNKFIIYSIQAARGVIYDSFGKQLVFNKPSFDLVLDKQGLPKLDSERRKVLEKVSEIIEENLQELIDQDENQNILISENLDHQKLILLETKIAELPGFQIEQNPVREYQNGENFSHLIGYTGKISAEELRQSPEDYSIFDYIGKEGIEKSYEEILRKKPGKLRFERDAQGNLISKEIIQFPESGKSLILWLDSELQEKIKEVLEKTLINVGAKKAVGIALDPKTGGILALVSLPSYDNNLFNKGADPETLSNLLKNPQEPLFNRVISGLYPTGSIIKPLIASAALEEKIISPNKKIYAGGFIEIPHKYNPEIVYTFKDWKVHDWVDMRQAIAQSCNVYFYTVGGGYGDQKGLGPSRIKKYLELFYWGNKTGIDLPGESQGFLPSPEWKKEVKKENWWDGDTYNLSIGQGDISVTPLQVATSFIAIANGGTIFKPRIVKQIVDPVRKNFSNGVDSEKNLIEEKKPEILRENFINQENLQIVREGMRKAVTGEGSPNATAVLLNSLPVPVAAKTGSAQSSKPNYYHNWITVFGPYEDPEIVLTIMFENVRETPVVTVPAAKEILEWYFGR